MRAAMRLGSRIRKSVEDPEFETIRGEHNKIVDFRVAAYSNDQQIRPRNYFEELSAEFNPKTSDPDPCPRFRYRALIINLYSGETEKEAIKELRDAVNRAIPFAWRHQALIDTRAAGFVYGPATADVLAGIDRKSIDDLLQSGALIF
ncbi:MAG: hypothetical protein V1659_02520 [Candidatus Woesearchaeota archaeon]